MTYEKFCAKYFTPKFVSFYGLRNILIAPWSILNNYINPLSHTVLPIELKYILKSTEDSQDMYTIYTSENNFTQKNIARWTRN